MHRRFGRSAGVLLIVHGTTQPFFGRSLIGLAGHYRGQRLIPASLGRRELLKGTRPLGRDQF